MGTQFLISMLFIMITANLIQGAQIRTNYFAGYVFNFSTMKSRWTSGGFGDLNNLRKKIFGKT